MSAASHMTLLRFDDRPDGDGAYVRPHRSPDELPMSGLPDWCIRVWLGIRAIQGNRDWTDYDTRRAYIAHRSGKSPSQVSHALAILIEFGWAEKDGSRYRCHVGGGTKAQITAFVRSRKKNGKAPKKPNEAQPKSDGPARAQPSQVPSRHKKSDGPSLSPTTPYKENPHCNPQEEEERAREANGLGENGGEATVVDAGEQRPPEDAVPTLAEVEASLPDEMQHIAAEVAALLAAGDAEKQGYIHRALRSGNTPPRSVYDAVAAVTTRAGPVAAVAALVTTFHEAQSRFYPQRLKHFQSVAQSIEDHHARQQHADLAGSNQTDSDMLGGTDTPRRRAPDPAGRDEPRRGEVRRSAAERRGAYSLRDAAEVVRRARALRGAGPPDADAGDAGGC